MDAGWAVPPDRFPMHIGAISLVGFKPIFRIFFAKPLHKIVPRDLRDDRRNGHGPDLFISPYDRFCIFWLAFVVFYKKAAIEKDLCSINFFAQ